MELRSQDSEFSRLRSMTPQERFAVSADMFNMLWLARQNLPGAWKRLDEQRWEEKLDQRLRMVDAFGKLDELRRERSAAENTG